MTQYQRNQILEAIGQCNRYIAKESPRSEDLRPVEIKDLLAFYYRHRSNSLLHMLADDAA